MASQALAKVSHDMWVYGITLYCPFSETHTHTLEHKMITKVIGRELNPLMQTTRQDYVHDMQCNDCKNRQGGVWVSHIPCQENNLLAGMSGFSDSAPISQSQTTVFGQWME